MKVTVITGSPHKKGPLLCWRMSLSEACRRPDGKPAALTLPLSRWPHAWLANLIHEMSGADIFRLERKTPYSSSSNGPVLYGETLDELRSEAVPELREYPDIEQYGAILQGCCNWWSSIPASVRSFLLHSDFSGKTIVPFCSMSGGQFGQTISAICKLAPNSVIKEGLMVTYSSYDRAEISAWLDSLSR